MAKRRRTIPARSHVNQPGGRPGFSRRPTPTQPRRRFAWTWVAVAVAGGIAVLLVLAYATGFVPGSGAPSPSPAPVASVGTIRPPIATPLANPPAEPAGNGTRATIETDLGNIEMELFTASAPVASENFINLAEAGFYNGVVFHRIFPGFMIQGGDPEGTGRGGPGYQILDDPVVGEYVRGTVAMARPAGQGGAFIPDSQGSQFFIVVADSPHLAGGGYSIFGRVMSGMEVVDAIVSGPRGGAGQDQALDPAVMERVTIQRP